MSEQPAKKKIFNLAEDLEKENEQLRQKNARLQSQVNDLQSGMYINCVYCGHRYGPNPGTPVAMADILKQHIENCPDHPMSTLKKRVAELEAEVAGLEHTIYVRTRSE